MQTKTNPAIRIIVTIITGIFIFTQSGIAQAVTDINKEIVSNLRTTAPSEGNAAGSLETTFKNLSSAQASGQTSPSPSIKTLSYKEQKSAASNLISTLAGWNRLDKTALVKSRLKYNDNQETLQLNLSNLEMENGNFTTKVLKDLTNLTELNLENNAVDNLSFLKGLKNLKTLNLSMNSIVKINNTKTTNDLSPLEELINLEELNLSKNSLLSGWRPLNISSLKTLPNLKNLNLSHNKISGISALRDMNKLTVLNLSANKIANILPLTNLKDLTVLNLSDNQITDLTDLENLANLKELNLSGNSKAFDITPLKKLTNLSDLRLFDNQQIQLEDFRANTTLSVAGTPAEAKGTGLSFERLVALRAKLTPSIEAGKKDCYVLIISSDQTGEEMREIIARVVDFNNGLGIDEKKIISAYSLEEAKFLINSYKNSSLVVINKIKDITAELKTYLPAHETSGEIFSNISYTAKDIDTWL